jgi:signal transduction histidine kinase
MDVERRVLLLEDDPDDAALVRRSLRGSPYSTVWCERMVLALERLKAGGVDVILCDLHLPDSSGLETVQRLKAAARGVPIVVLTGSVGAEDGLESVRAGAQDYLSKDELVGPHLVRTLSFACERQEIDRFKEELVRMVAHELRSPAATAVSCLDLLREEYARALPPEAREMLQKADQSLGHLLAVLDDLAQAHRAGLGRLTIAITDVDAAAAVREAAEALTGRARARGITLAVEAPPVGKVHADPARLRQVLTNLADNALKFTEPGGRVTLTVGPHDRTDCAQFAVVDTGPGIAPEEAAKVFDKLYQAPLGRKAGGLGLGLYIAREFVQLQGGMIWVESRPGVGTAFRFTLPSASPRDGGRHGRPAERLL